MPDLISKLREVVASRRKWAEHVAKVCMAESNQFRAGDIIAFCDELESLLGLEGQAATVAGRMEQTFAEHTRRLGLLIAEEQEKPLPNNVLIAALCDSIRLAREAVAIISQPSPSTPIVPSTAGLSAENIKLKIGSRFYDREPYSGAWDEPFNVACEVLNAALAERPAPAPVYKGMMISDSRKQEAHERMMTTPYSLHCAQIRNDALEEAAQVLDRIIANCIGRDPEAVVERERFKNIAKQIRALAERPAPAREVKGEKS